MAEKISRRLALLSSAAIGAVYLAGYFGTQAADASLGGAATTSATTTETTAAATAASQAAITTTTTVTVTAPAVTAATAPAAPATTVARPPTATPRPTVTPAPAATATPVAAGLRDGTYNGAGNSRRGGISVALTVKSGRITNVAITGSSTQYPVSWIADLPAEVIAAQSAQVDLISGATYSSEAFQGAVQQALAQAQA